MARKKGPRFIGKRPRGRTMSLPGLEDKRIEELTDLALKLSAVRQDLAEDKNREKKAKDAVLLAMKENGLMHYHDSESDVFVEIETPADKVSVLVGKGKKKPKGEEE